MKRKGSPPSKDEIATARDKTVPDVIAPGLKVLFVGINPGLYSGATGHHFARPGNRFWPALYRSGFTMRQLDPFEERELLAAGLGITNLVRRTTAAAAELDKSELIAGGKALVRKVRRYEPRAVAILGVGAYRSAFDRRSARIGRQPGGIADARLWLLPNPSGLNAHYQLPDLAREFARLRESLDD